MNILALDLGTNTGYALWSKQLVSCGTWVLATKKELAAQKRQRLDRRRDIRFQHLIDNLLGIQEDYQLDYIVFEDVQFAKSSMQAHLWATWRAAVWWMHCEFDIDIECCPVGTLKKFATGHGGADKAFMALCLKDARFKHDKDGIIDTLTKERLDDNAVDALHLLSWARHTLRNIKGKK